MYSMATLAKEGMVLMPVYRVQEIKTYKITADDEDDAIFALSDDDLDYDVEDYLLDVDITVSAYN